MRGGAPPREVLGARRGILSLGGFAMHNHLCPFCGGAPAPERFTFDPEFHLIRFGGREVTIAPAQYEIARAMLRAYPRPVYADWLCSTCQVTKRALRKRLERLRPKMAEIGVSIVTDRHAVSEVFYRLVLPESAAPKAAPAARRATRSGRPALVCVG